MPDSRFPGLENPARLCTTEDLGRDEGVGILNSFGWAGPKERGNFASLAPTKLIAFFKKRFWRRRGESLARHDAPIDGRSLTFWVMPRGHLGTSVWVQAGRACDALVGPKNLADPEIRAPCALLPLLSRV